MQWFWFAKKIGKKQFFSESKPHLKIEVITAPQNVCDFELEKKKEKHLRFQRVGTK